MTHETLMSKIVKIFQGPTDMTTLRSSDPELKKSVTYLQYFAVLSFPLQHFLMDRKYRKYIYPKDLKPI